MDYIDVEGATPQEALRRILSKLGMKEEEVRYQVLRPHSPTQQALVRVWAEPKEVQETRQIIEGLLRAMGMDARVRFLLLAKKHYSVNLETRSFDSILIGRGGETLRSLEYLLNLMLRRKRVRIQIELDVSGYKQRQLNLLVNKAIAVAVRVKETGKEMTIDPLPPDKRHYIREILRQDPEIRVYTAGRGSEIYLVVAPRKAKPE